MYLVLAQSHAGEWTPRYNGRSPVKTAEVAKVAREGGALEVIVYRLEEGVVYAQENFDIPDFIQEVVVYHFKQGGEALVDEHHRRFFEWAA